MRSEAWHRKMDRAVDLARLVQRAGVALQPQLAQELAKLVLELAEEY